MFFIKKRIISILLFLLFIIFLITRDTPSNKTDNNDNKDGNSYAKEIIHEISSYKDTKLVESGLIDIEDTGLTNEEKQLLREKQEMEKKKLELDPCTIKNPLTNQFYDLRELSSFGSESEKQAWNSKGFDYGRNFSIGICSTPLKQINAITELDFIDSNNKSNIAGYYTNLDGNKVSIGEISTKLKFRGLNLVLEYKNGDKCETSTNLNKSTLLTFKCDREMMSKARVNYLGSMNDCSYFFEVRTVHACPTSNEETDDAVWGIFFIILLSAVLVYLFAGVMYKIIKKHYESSVKDQRDLV